MNWIQKYENFGEKLTESKKEDDTLYIFDLDDTLTKSESFEDLSMKLIKEDLTVKSLLDSSIKRIGVKLSDLKYDNGRIYVNDSIVDVEPSGNWIRKGKRIYLVAPNKFYDMDDSLPIELTELSKKYKSVGNKAIVTGRLRNMSDKILNTLDKLGLEEPNFGLHCYSMHVKDTDRVGVWKAKTIVKLIKDNGFKKAYFYEDNHKWLRSVTSLVSKELPDVDFTPIKI